MTREEAINVLNNFPIDFRNSGGFEAMEALKIAILALRPVSREQVERIRGEWMFPIFGDQQDANDPRCQCSKCGSIETPLARHRFCPSCGAPMTDEAVEMVMDQPTLTPPNEALICDGCLWAEMGALEKCSSCMRDKKDNYYRRPPEGEVDA